MTGKNCKIEGQIEEVERLLRETTTEKSKLEQRLEELKQERDRDPVVDIILKTYHVSSGFLEGVYRDDVRGSIAIKIRPNSEGKVFTFESIQDVLKHNSLSLKGIEYDYGFLTIFVN